ncbi:MAG: hypothetical protein JXA15_11850, partial [Spirochaetales bacterium]|nr:hypothetical protein [Spirochaetales bacterium]
MVESSSERRTASALGVTGRAIALVAALSVTLGAFSLAAQQGPTLRLAPSYGIPLGLEGGIQGPLSLGARLGFSFGGGFLGVGALAPELGLGYALTDLVADGTALASFEARAGLGASFPLAQALSARAALSGRYAYYRLVQGETVTSGGSPGLEGEL